MTSASTFPRLGLNITYLKHFLDVHNFRSDQERESWTTDQVCERIVRPETEALKISYCEQLRSSNPKNVNEATIFISHAWLYKYTDFMDAILSHFKDLTEEECSSTYLWIDIFSNNQHLTDLNYPFEWWSTTFFDAVKAFGHVILVLTTLVDPLPMTRGWCLWEIYSAYKTKSRFEVALSTENERAFIQYLKEGNNLFFDIVGKVSSIRSTCKKEEDKRQIHRAIEEIGFHTIDGIVLQQLRSWVIDVCRKNVSNAKDNKEKIQSLYFLCELLRLEGLLEDGLQAAKELSDCFLGSPELQQDKDVQEEYLLCANTKALILKAQGNYKEAEKIYSQTYQEQIIQAFGDSLSIPIGVLINVVEIQKALFQYDKAAALLNTCNEKLANIHEEDKDEKLKLYSLLAKNSLSEVYCFQFKYQEARRLLEDCLIEINKVSGDDHPYSLTVKSNLANVYQGLGMYVEAESFFRDIYHRQRALRGNLHPDTMTAAGNFATQLTIMDKRTEAKEIFETLLEHSKQVYGESNPITLRIMCNFSNVLLSSHDWKEAETLLKACLSYYDDNDCDQTKLVAQNNLGEVYSQIGLYEEAEEIFMTCYSYRLSLQQENHPETLTILGNLAILYGKMKRYEIADAKYQQCLELFTSHLGERHPKTLTILHSKAVYYREKGDIEAAKTLLRDCYLKTREVLGEENGRTITVLMEYCTIDPTSEEIRQAWLRWREIAREKEENYSESSSQALGALGTVSFLSYYLQDYSLFEDCERRCLRIKKQLYPTGLTGFEINIVNLSGFFLNQKRFPEAKQFVLAEYRDANYHKPFESPAYTLRLIQVLCRIYEKQIEESDDLEEKREYISFLIDCLEKALELFGEENEYVSRLNDKLYDVSMNYRDSFPDDSNDPHDPHEA